MRARVLRHVYVYIYGSSFRYLLTSFSPSLCLSHSIPPLSLYLSHTVFVPLEKSLGLLSHRAFSYIGSGSLQKSTCNLNRLQGEPDCF